MEAKRIKEVRLDTFDMSAKLGLAVTYDDDTRTAVILSPEVASEMLSVLEDFFASPSMPRRVSGKLSTAH